MSAVNDCSLDSADVVTTPARPQSKRVWYRTRYEEVHVAMADEHVSVVLREFTTKHDDTFYTDSHVNLPPLQALELGRNLVFAAHKLLESAKQREEGQ